MVIKSTLLTHVKLVQPKSVLKNRKSEFDGILDDDEPPACGFSEDALHPSNTDSVTDCNVSLGSQQYTTSSILLQHI